MRNIWNRHNLDWDVKKAGGLSMKTQVVHSSELGLSGNREVTMKAVTVAIYSFLVPRATLLGLLSPFAVITTASLPLRYAWLSLIGNLLGYVVMGFHQQNLIYITSILFVMAVKTMLKGKRIGAKRIFLSLLSGGSYLGVTMFANQILSFENIDLFLRICESFLIGGMTYIACMGTTAFLKQKSLRQYHKLELASCGILALICLLALMDYRILGFHPGIIAAVILLSVIVEKQGMIGGTVAGVLVACAVSLYDTNQIYMAGILVISSLLAGVFHRIGRLGQEAVFLSVAMFGVFISGITIELLFFMMDLLIGCGIYFMIPTQYLTMFDLTDTKVKSDTAMKDNLENRLEFAARTVEDLQDSLDRVSKKLNQVKYQSPDTICQKTAGYVCKNCGLNLFCWDESYNDTVDYFRGLMDTIRKKGVLTEEDLEKRGEVTCCKKNLLLEKFNQNYQDYLATENTRKRIFEVQNLASEQLSGISEMLWEVSNELSEIDRQDTEAAAQVTALFSELFAPPQSVFCTINQYDRMEIDLYLSSGVEFEEETLCREVSHLLGRKFVMPSVVQVDNQVRISFYEKANFVADFGFRQISSSQSKDGVCGDSYEYFTDKRGTAYLILSDGMGNGKQASLDSRMACSMVRKLIRSGFGMESMLRFVNSSLQFKSMEESSVTLDVVKLDLYTGHAECYKAGGASSFIKTGQHVSLLESKSLPAGILSKTKFEKQLVSLNCGDFILLCSDGLLDIGEEKIVKVIEAAGRKRKDYTAQEWADGVYHLFLTAVGEGQHDDVTILVLKLDPGIE